MKARSCLFAVALTLAGIGCAKNTANGPSARDLNPPIPDKVNQPTINANTHFAAGQLAESRNNIPAAIEQYKIALKQKPDYQPAIYRLAILYTTQKEFAPALQLWQQYVKLTDGSAGAYSNLALCEEYSGRPGEAEADYRRGVKADPKAEACRVNYGLMLARHDRIGEATIQLQAVLPQAEVHYNLAVVYEGEGRREQARIEYQKAVALNPEMTDARARLADLN